jgi:hypothetical protein
MTKFDKLRRRLRDMSTSDNITCRDFSQLLKDFDFDLDDASGGHKIATHPAIPLGPADAANYNCGHDKGTKVRRNYIKKFLRIVDEYEQELREHLK